MLSFFVVVAGIEMLSYTVFNLSKKNQQPFLTFGTTDRIDVANCRIGTTSDFQSLTGSKAEVLKQIFCCAL